MRMLLNSYTKSAIKQLAGKLTITEKVPAVHDGTSKASVIPLRIYAATRISADQLRMNTCAVHTLLHAQEREAVDCHHTLPVSRDIPNKSSCL